MRCNKPKIQITKALIVCTFNNIFIIFYRQFLFSCSQSNWKAISGWQFLAKTFHFNLIEPLLVIHWTFGSIRMRLLLSSASSPDHVERLLHLVTQHWNVTARNQERRQVEQIQEDFVAIAKS